MIAIGLTELFAGAIGDMGATGLEAGDTGAALQADACGAAGALATGAAFQTGSCGAAGAEGTEADGAGAAFQGDTCGADGALGAGAALQAGSCGTRLVVVVGENGADATGTACQVVS